VSILLVGLPEGVAEATIERLRAQGDEVRVIEPDPAAQQRWRSAGAYVATGDLDADLVERAAQGVRTLVLGRWLPAADDPIEELLAGAVRAGVGRVVVYTDRGETERWTQAFAESVVLRAPHRRTPFGRGPRGLSEKETAELIDAADDIAGPLRLDLDVTTESWAPLGLAAPWEN
jgi:phosphatidylserine/phosphatidylglycerophosphate/cardiolipin synthase-like enzyme